MLTFNWSSPKNQVNFGGGLASSAMHSTATSAWSAILTLYSCGALMSAILIWTVVGGTMNQKIFNVVIISKQELIKKYIKHCKSVNVLYFTGNCYIDISRRCDGIVISVHCWYLALPLSVVTVLSFIDGYSAGG